MSLCWLLLGVLPLLFFQTAIHEGSHCVMFEVTGVGCRVTAPFAVTFTSGGRAYGVTVTGDPSVPMPVAAIIAPQLLAAFLIVALRLVARRVRDERLAILTRLWLLGACVDLLNNTVAPSSFGDWSILASEFGLPRAQRIAVTLPLWGLVAWTALTPVPGVVSRTSARVRDLWPIGVVYAAVSALAAFVSLALEVPDTDPTTPWHRAPILLQTLSVVACLAVVAASRLTVAEREAA